MIIKLIIQLLISVLTASVINYVKTDYSVDSPVLVVGIILFYLFTSVKFCVMLIINFSYEEFINELLPVGICLGVLIVFLVLNFLVLRLITESLLSYLFIISFALDITGSISLVFIVDKKEKLEDQDDLDETD